MTPVPTPSSVTDPTLEAEPLVCPDCGYDLRAAPAGRCSECGQLIDEVELRTSGFPWARRHERGRVRTYLRTVWLVSAGSRRIAHEASRPQKLGDARAFRWVTAALVGVALLGAFALAVASDGGLTFLAAQPADRGGMRDSDRWIRDVIIPWCAGATMWPVIPIVLIGWTLYVTGVQRRLFRPKDASAAQLDRAQAVALYAVAPLAFIFPAVLWAAVMALLVKTGTIRERRLGAFLWATSPLWGAAILLTLLRTVQWSIRARRGGRDRALIDVPHLLVLWLFGLFAWFLFIPWSVGFFWLVIDSLRR